MELLRNCSHGSETCTYLVTGENSRKMIIKTATTAAGISDLEREIDGWKFYQQIRYPNRTDPLCRIDQKSNNYLKIIIEFINGFNPDSRDYKRGLEKNAPFVSKVVDHYCNVWPCQIDNTAAMHGDLSLDNLIYNEGIHIIDWEHYKPSGVPWGFDILYFLYETLWFGMRGREHPTREEVIILTRTLHTINSYRRLPKTVIMQPLRFIYNFVINNRDLWCSQFCKIVILRFSDSQIFRIDELVSAEILRGE